MKTKTRLQKSFIGINQKTITKAKKVFGIKEKGLTRMAENTLYYGIHEDDSSLDDILKEYFKKLRHAFLRRYNFYLNAQYVFCFDGALLVEIFSIHDFARNSSQQLFRQNNDLFSSFDLLTQENYKKSIRDFLTEHDIQSEFGFSDA